MQITNQSLLLGICLSVTSLTCPAQDLRIDLQGYRYSAHQAATPQQALVQIPAKLQISLTQQGAYKQLSSTLFPGDIEFRFLTLGNTNGAAVYDLLGWRAGTEFDALDSKNVRESRADAFFLVPSLLLRTAKDRQAMSTPAELQASYQFESFIDQAGRPATVVIDKRTGQAVSARGATFTYEYQYNGTGNQAPTAQSIKVKLGDNLIADWQSVSVSEAPLTAQEFAVPNGYQARQAVGNLSADKIADGVYRINGSKSGYHMHFVVGEHSVALFDSPIFPNEITAIKTLISNIAPGKNISHLVLSHTHRDHIGGATQLVQDGTQIFTGQDGDLAIQRQLGKQIHAKTVTITKATNIDVGGRTIQVMPAPSSHASDMLIAYDAQSNILFQGDFFMMPEVGPVPIGFTVNRELHQQLKNKGLSPERIVSVHGRVGTLQELSKSVELLDASKLQK